MRTLSFLVSFAVLLAACPKAKDGTATKDTQDIWANGPQERVRRVPEGWEHIDLPPGSFDARPNSTLAVEDGTVWIAGSAVKIAQYQWVLRASNVDEPKQHVYDPGRIIQIASNGTGGISAVGVLGGIPSDNAWFANIDAFGEVSSRQTYPANGAGRLLNFAVSADGQILSGTVAEGLGMQGWLIAADMDGSDQWKMKYGGTGDHALTWVTTSEAETIAVGRYRAEMAPDEAWYVRVDAEGKVLAERHWAPKDWTRLSTAVAHPTGDLIAAGLVSSTDLGPDDGAASLWIGRLTPKGMTTWDRFEREDVSEVNNAVPWKGGLAVVVRTGGVGTADRRTWLVRCTDDGVVTWTALNLPEGVDLAEVHAVNEDTLQLVAVISDKEGISWTSYALALMADGAVSGPR